MIAALAVRGVRVGGGASVALYFLKVFFLKLLAILEDMTLNDLYLLFDSSGSLSLFGGRRWGRCGREGGGRGNRGKCFRFQVVSPPLRPGVLADCLNSLQAE